MSAVNGNDGFSKVKDSIYDSKLMEGLSNLGVLPHTFQAIQAVLDIDDVTVADDGVATAGTIVAGESGRFLDVHTGEPVILGSGQQVVLCQAAVTTTLVAGTGATLSIGLAVAGTTDALTTVLTTATVFGTLNTAGMGLTNPGNVVGSSAHYLKGVAAVEAFTAGVIQVLLIVV